MANIILSKQWSSKGGISVTPTASGGYVEIEDGHGNKCGGHIDNDKLLALGQRMIAVANRQHPNKIIMPGD